MESNEVIQRLIIEFNVSWYISYANYCNQKSIRPIDFIVTNISKDTIEGLSCRITSSSSLIKEYVDELPVIEPETTVSPKNLRFEFDKDYLLSLMENESATITFQLFFEGELIYQAERDTEIVPFDFWRSSMIVEDRDGNPVRYSPPEYKALLASFSTPNHPVVKEIAINSSKWLEKFTGNPSFDGYQSEDSNRVRQMVASIYAEIQKKNIVYSEPPASFGMGQRIRLCDDIAEQHVGTCMDLTMLFSSCLESIGLHPVLILHEGHIYCGCWLVNDCFQDGIVEDSAQILKRTASGIDEMIIFECTAVCSGKDIDFNEACKIANITIEDGTFEAAIDIKGLRWKGYRPLPLRIKDSNGIHIEHEERDEESISGKADEVEYIDLSDIEKDKKNKVQYWERKLLDLSTRNSLINTRIKNVVMMPCDSLSNFEDKLSDGNEYVISGFKIEDVDEMPIEELQNIGKNAEFVKEIASQKGILAYGTERSVNSLLTKMYRQAKNSLEESGSNTLFLALGFLRWYEGKTPRYSPLVLVPIDLTRKAGIGFCLRKRDEDTEFNITLLELLKQEFSLEINGLDPLPTDEHGIDIRKVIAIVRTAVKDKTNWDVVEAAAINNYSFTQFVMWSDLHRSVDKLSRNKIVRSLINGAVDWDTTINESDEKDDIYLPISVDDSQLNAIKMAVNGNSFVLHGPPGTGKSQTITAMISNAIAKGKTVLFVAEKMAALEVVDKRLSALGLEPFCLELHSHKSSKKNVLEQLEASINLKYRGIKSDFYKNTENDLFDARNKLDKYSKELHKQYPFGYSLRQLIDKYESMDINEIKSDVSDVFSLDAKTLQNRKKLIDKLIYTGNEAKELNKDILSRFNVNEYSYDLRIELNEALENYTNAIEKLEKEISNYSSLYSTEVPSTNDDWSNFIDELETIDTKDIKTINDEDSEIDYDAFFSKIIEVFENKQKIINRKNEIEDKWDESFIQMNMDDLRKELESANSRLLGKSKYISALVNKVQSYTKYFVKENELNDIFNEIDEYKEIDSKLEQLTSDLDEEQISILSSLNDIDEINAEKEKRINKQKEDDKNRQELLKKDQKYFENQKEDSKKLLKLIKDTEDIQNVIKNKGVNVSSFKDKTCKEIVDECENIDQSITDLQTWISYKEAKNTCVENHLQSVVDAYENNGSTNLIESYEKGLYKALILGIIKNSDVLNKFSGSSFNENINEFKKIDDEFVDITKEEIYYILAHQLPARYESLEVNKELAILKKVIASKGRGYTIRSLFNEIPHVLTRICPCVLMSPISVAQYLSPDTPPFDIVIFDEASQLPTCKAVGVLARGKDAVIVGDPKQMPPTTFFSSNTVDEDNMSLEDLDSILDDCLALGMPETHLEWHYRSRHESLIAFSNQEFYGNKMLTFPSVNDQERRVRYIPVHGYYDQKTGTNEAEARSIVKEILRRYKNEKLSKKSIGVVTLNMKQQNYIDDLLQEEFKNDEQFEAWANNGNEPLFVKNLENVQGDERDVILFSILFGPNQNGKLSLNFGPINKEGGWKRLNVAASRAKQEMIVFSIMSYDMINTSKTSSIGVASLRNFLEFAERGRISNSYKYNDPKEEGIAKKIIAKLKENDYECVMNVGHSEFKIDIAVINPFDTSTYLLGIILDGEIYGRTDNTRDREIAQISVLKGLGWNTYRIWTMDFWSDEKRTINNLINKLNILKEEAANKEKEKIDDNIEPVDIDVQDPKQQKKSKTKKKEKTTKVMVSEEISKSTGTTIKKAKAVSNKENGRKYVVEQYNDIELTAIEIDAKDLFNKEVQDLMTTKINELVEQEAPISTETLEALTLISFGFDEQTSVCSEAFNKALKKANVQIKKDRGMKWAWKKDQDINSYHIYRYQKDRDIYDICTIELINGLCACFEEKGAMDIEQVFNNMSIMLGHMEMDDEIGNLIAKTLSKAIKLDLVDFDEDNNVYYLR